MIRYNSSIFTNMQIKTHRLLIEPLQASDLKGYIALGQDQDVMKYIRGGEARSLALEVEDFEVRLKRARESALCNFSVVNKQTNEFLGICLIDHPSDDDWNHLVHVGYRFHKKHWGKGYATEVVAALVNYAQLLKLPYLHAFVDEQNDASLRVLQKNGFQFYSYSQIYGSDCVLLRLDF